MLYKKSLYNVFVEYKNEQTIIFNTLSGAIGIFDRKTLDRYIQENLTIEETEILHKKGILVDVSEDEKVKINSDRISGIENPQLKYFRIWTTSACNARCYYCFENGISPVTMTPNTANDVADFIISRLTDKDQIWIEWFGGEPLLNTEAVDLILSKLKPVIRERHCSIRNSIISNGSLITDRLALHMKEAWNIRSIQITLDGYDDDYNRIKNYKCAKYNFDRVIHSIHLMSMNGIHVAVRMNYDTQNYESICKLIEYLYIEFGNDPNISYYVYPVWSSLDKSFLSETKADENLIRIYDLLVQKGMNTWRKLARLNYKKRQCNACSTQSFTIFPDGSLGKCSEVFTQKIGTIHDGITNHKVVAYWTRKTLDNECDLCVYLPICQGGCRAAKCSNMQQCFPHKDIFDKILVWYVDHLFDEMKQSENS